MPNTIIFLSIDLKNVNNLDELVKNIYYMTTASKVMVFTENQIEHICEIFSCTYDAILLMSISYDPGLLQGSIVMKIKNGEIPEKVNGIFSFKKNGVTKELII